MRQLILTVTILATMGVAVAQGLGGGPTSSGAATYGSPPTVSTTSWSEVPAPSTASANSNQLNRTSCVTASFCAGVGMSSTTGGTLTRSSGTDPVGRSSIRRRSEEMPSRLSLASAPPSAWPSDGRVRRPSPGVERNELVDRLDGKPPFRRLPGTALVRVVREHYVVSKCGPGRYHNGQRDGGRAMERHVMDPAPDPEPVGRCRQLPLNARSSGFRASSGRRRSWAGRPAGIGQVGAGSGGPPEGPPRYAVLRGR